MSVEVQKGKTYIDGIALRPFTGLGPRQLMRVLDNHGACTEGKAATQHFTLAQAWRYLPGEYLVWWLREVCEIRVEMPSNRHCCCRGCYRDQAALAQYIRAKYRFDGTRKLAKGATHV